MKTVAKCSLIALAMLGIISCANANKTSEFAPEKDVDSITAVSADVPRVNTDTINNPDAEPVAP